MIFGYFHRLRSLTTHKFHQHVHVNGERAMDNLMGTMIGVLFLAIISVSFAGIYMAYTVSSHKAAENNDRVSIITRYSTNTLNNLHIESNIGSATATAAGWTVLSHNKALSATTTLAANADFKDFTFAATRPMVDGGTILVSQWGVNKDGLVTIYTALPKAGSQTSKCNWTESKANLEKLCNVAIDRIQSVVAPPMGVDSSEAVLWEDQITKYPWQEAAFDWADDTKRTVTTSELGTIETNGETTLSWVAMFDDLTPGKKVAIDFVDSNFAVYSHSFTPVASKDEKGKLTRSAHGTLAVPEDVTSLTAYVDTDMASPTAGDQTVKIYRFNVYQKNEVSK